MTESLIQDVSDTAFWVANYRALESERADALFRDPLAARLAGEQGRQIAAAMPRPAMTAWTIAMRTCIIDDYIRAAVAQGVNTVLNLGAGLDTRPYRLELPAALQWIEADYPHVMDYKEKHLSAESPVCRLERVRIDLADVPARQALFASLDAQDKQVLVLTEGVIPYLSTEEVALLAVDLKAMKHVSAWIVDYFAPAIVKSRQRQDIRRKMEKVAFRFAPEDWFGFFAEQGWQSRQIRYFSEEGERHRRPAPMPWHVKTIVRLGSLLGPRKNQQAYRQFAGYVWLEPLPETSSA